jgi:hypothetical protein
MDEQTETVETPTEAPVETPATEEILEQAPASEETLGETVVEKAVDEEVKESATEEAKEEAVEEPKEETQEEAVEIDTAAELPVVLEKVNEILEKYDLPADVQTAIDALRAKAEVTPPEPEIVAQLADYGDVDTVKETLDTANLLSSVTILDDGSIRPNTDKFVQKIVEADPNTASWLYYDIASSPSTTYQGLTKFEEGIANALAVEGDTIGSVLARYHMMMANARNSATIPESDVPEFIPPELHPAFRSLPKETREEIQAMVPVDPDEDYFVSDRNRKLLELAAIQKGIDADLRDAQTAIKTKQEEQSQLNNEIVQTQVKFFDQMREVFTENLVKEVVFSTDPRLQVLLARQQVTTLTQAFSPDSDGDYARAALKDAGITFNQDLAQSLAKEVQDASVKLTMARRQVDSEGRQLNQVELNRAVRSFEDVTRKFQDFAADILAQEQKLTSTGKQEEIKTEVAKIKLQPKARPALKSSASTVKEEKQRPAYRTDEWYDDYAAGILAEQERKAAAYT